MKLICSGNVAVQDSVVNKMLLNPKDFSESELLKQAEISIDSKNYFHAFAIYALDIFKNNPVANCNLGYLYSNGFGLEKNTTIAEEYYLRAEQLGCEEATINRFVLYVDNIEPNNDYEKKVYLTINEILQDSTHIMYDKIKAKFGEDKLFGNVSDLREKHCGSWEDTGFIKEFTEVPPISFRECWVFKNSKSVEKNGVYGRSRIYKQQKRTCSFDNLFEENIIRN